MCLETQSFVNHSFTSATVCDSAEWARLV